MAEVYFRPQRDGRCIDLSLANGNIDIVISLKEIHLKEAEKAMTKLGLQSRLPVRAEDIYKFKKEYVENRNLIAWSFVDHSNSTRQIDILITQAYEDLDVTSVAFGGQKIPVVSMRGLMEMKQKAGRPQDLIDVENIQEKLRGKKSSPRERSVSPEEGVEFLESFRILMSEKDEPTKLISIRIPENILNLLKTKAKLDGKKYQSLIIELLRKDIKTWR